MKRIYTCLFVITLFLSACNWFRYTPEVADNLAAHFNNKLYRQFDTAAYNPVFSKLLDSFSKTLKNPALIKQWYAAQGNEPQLITRFYTNGELDALRNYIANSTAHGFNPEIFGLKNLGQLKSALDQNNFKTIDEVYPVVARLEIASAAALLDYYNAIYFGCINPKNYLSRYYIKVARPDSVSMGQVLSTANLGKLLKDAQPSSTQYKTLQQQLDTVDAVKKNTLLVNMERLRWKLPSTGTEYVLVNIPDFSLTWLKDADTVTYMKVCVGGKREDGFEEKIAKWLKTHNLEDKPRNHETPLLISRFNSIQVNPVWNIPNSIAQSEIYYLAIKDRYYLSNSNIKVYYKDKLVADPDTIQWAKYNREKLPFRFKQGSGEGNALGKFKFIFDNSSSIYLHDTNNKNGFFLKNRAISHGCIRIEKPLDFAEKLLNDKYAYDQLRMEVNLPPVDTTKMKRFARLQAMRNDTLNRYTLKPKWFGVKQDVPLLINYVTAWVQNGAVQYRPDIYGHDAILLKAMKKYASIR